MLLVDATGSAVRRSLKLETHWDCSLAEVAVLRNLFKYEETRLEAGLVTIGLR